MKKALILILGLCMLISVVACAGPEATSQAPAKSTSASTTPASANNENTPKKGGTFVIGWNAAPDNFLSNVTSLNNIHVFTDLMFPALLAYDANNNMAIQTTELAESYTFVDNKVLTFKLREAYWSDGVPITSKDVKFTIENFTKNLSPFGTQFLSKLKSVETPDDKTVIITLNEEFPKLPYFWHWHYCTIMPEHVWKDYTSNYQACPEYNKPTVFGGAWMLDEYIVGNHATYVPNPKYWKKNQPYLDKLIIRIIPDENTLISALETGEIDCILPQALAYDEASRLANNKSFTVTNLGKEIRGTVYYTFFNLNGKYTSNINVRRALIKAIDQQKLINDIFTGNGKILNSCIPEGVMWDKYRITPKNVYSYDVQAAKKMLDEAGYSAGSDGMRGIKLTYVAQNTTKNVKLGENLKSFWKEIGVDLEIVSLETAAWKERVFKKFDFDCAPIDAGVATDFSIEGRWYTSARIGVDMGNAWQLKNTRVDEIFQTVAKQDEATQIKMYAELQEAIAETAIGIFLQNRAPQVFSNKFGGLPIRPDSQFNSWDSVYSKDGKPIQ